MSSSKHTQQSTSRMIPAFKKFDQKIPKNKKYDKVQGKVDTGSSIRRYEERMQYIRSNFRMTKGEIFKRMKTTTLVTLIVEVAEAMDHEDVSIDDLDEASTFGQQQITHNVSETYARDGPSVDGMSDATGATNCSSRSTLLSVISGVGAMDDPTVPPPQATARLALQRRAVAPYLIVDLRTKDEYDACHIVGAHSFPKSMLSRANNYFSPLMYEYINKDDRILIVYDNDEKIAAPAAETFVQRGVTNVFLLSGGLHVLCEKFPDGMTEGEARPVGRDSANPPALAALTRANIERIRDQLDRVLVSSSPSVMSGASSSRSQSRASSTATARSTTSSKAWR